MDTAYPTLGGLTLYGTDPFGVLWITDDVKGWGAPGGTLAPAQKPRQDGAWAGASYSQARPVVLSGTAIASTSADAWDALDRLISAASLGSTVLSIVEPSRTRWANVRRDGEVIPTWQTPTAFSWSVQLVALDPRKFGLSLTGSTSLPSSSGGLSIPFTVPFLIGASSTTGQVSLFNSGNTAGPVTLRIDGPCVGPVITHVGAGRSQVFALSSLSLAAGEWLTIDMDKRTVMANDQATRSNFVTSREWSVFEPGLNTWSFAAASYTSGALLTVTASPAFK